MVQHTLLVKNVANSLLRVELAKLLGDQHKIVTVSFRNQPSKKGGIKYALVVVDSQADLATVSGLLDKKTVHGKELKVAAAKAPHEKGSYAARVQRLKSLEKFRSVWPAPTYKNVANSDPLKNLAFPPAFVHGERLSIEPAKTIKKKVAAPSRALYLSKLPKTVNKKQILEAFKNVKIQHTILTKNKKKLNYGFLLFKNAEERKKAQDVAKDGKVTIGEHTVAVQEASKFAKQTVVEPVVKITKAAAAPAAAKKDLSVNGIAKKRFTAYRVNLHNRKQRQARLAAIKKLKEHKQAVTQGKAQPRVVRKLTAKKTIVKPNPEVAKKAQLKAARKARHAKGKLNANKKTVKVAAKAPVAAETATA